MQMRLAAIITLVLPLALSGPAGAAEHTVKVVSDYENLRMAFEPRLLEIAPGDTVTWINQADEEHDMMTYPDGYPKAAQPFRSPRLQQAGEQFSVTFDKPGTFEYHCTPHMVLGMRGTVIVGAPSSHAEMHEPGRAELLAYRTILLEFFDAEDLADLGVE